MANYQAQSKTQNTAILEMLTAKRYTLRRAAKALGVTPGHLSRVINGVRESETLIHRIANLPEPPQQKSALLHN